MRRHHVVTAHSQHWPASVWFLLILVTAAVSFGVALGGCASMSSQQKTSTVVAVAGDVMECGADNYSTVKTAIESGGNTAIGSWISAIIGLFQCVPKVVRDIEAQQAIALLADPASYMLATVDDEAIPLTKNVTGPKPLTRNGRRRLAAAKILGDVLNRNVTVKP